MAAAFTAATWGFTQFSIITGERQARAHVVADVSVWAGALSWELGRQLDAIDEAIASILAERQRSGSDHLDAASWAGRSPLPGKSALQLKVLNPQGVVVSSTLKDSVGADLATGEDFKVHRDGRRADLITGRAIHDGGTYHWAIDVSRRIDGADGSFAGVLILSYVPSELSDVLRGVDLDANGMLSLAGSGGSVGALVSNGRMVSGGITGQTETVAHLHGAQGVWAGLSTTDSVERIHAFRRLEGHDLTVDVGADAGQAMRAVNAWAANARVFAAGISVLSVLMAALLIREVHAAQGREARLAHDRATLENAFAALAIAKASAEAKTSQLEATIRGMSDGVVMLDADLRLVQWNDRFAQLSGVPVEMLRVGTSAEDLLRAQARNGEFGPVDVEAETGRRMAELRAFRGIRVFDRQRPSGRTCEMRWSALPNGGFVALCTDITARKLVEEAQVTARRAAEDAARQKSRFVAMVSHEIRTPLNALVNSLALLDEPAMSEAHQRLSGTARHAGFALLDLVNDVLELSELESGRPALRPTAFDLRPVLEGVRDMFSTQAEARGLSLSVDIAADLPGRIHADGGRIRQVIMNFVSNATKFSKPGQITIGAAVLEDARGLNVLKLSVRDQGPRISQADAAQLFRPFSRLENARSSGVAGTGLGLAICDRLIRLMNGSIGTAAAGPDGNEFWATLPLVPARAAVAVARLPAGRRMRRASVLVVEDIPSNHFVTATMLRREGHRVDVAETGADAVALVSRFPYDLVFMDLLMPGMDGYEAARRIRALGGATSKVPIVALTATVASEDRARCMEAGLDDMLAKPVRPANLNEMLARTVWKAGHPSVTGHAEGRVARPAPAQSLPVLDSDRVAELRQGFPAAKLATLVEECLADMRDRLTLLEQALAAGQPDAIEESAHALAGMAATYGLVAFERRMRRLMEAARHQDPSATSEAGEDLDVEFSRAASAIRHEMEVRLVT